MVSAIVFGSSGPGVSSGQGHCVVFLDKTLYTQVPLSAQVHQYRTGELDREGNSVME